MGRGNRHVRRGSEIIEDFVPSFSNGSLAFQMQRLADVPLAAVVVEGLYSELFRLNHLESGWLADILSRLHARYPEIQVTFGDTRDLPRSGLTAS